MIELNAVGRYNQLVVRMVIQRNEYQAHAGPELQFFSSPNCAILAVSTWSVLPQDIPVDLLMYKPEIPVQEICLALQN
jgi:hypothetical protein